MINILIVDDHELVRVGIRRLIEDCEALRVVAEAKDGNQAIQAVKTYAPDVVLLDIKMPGMDGWEVTRRLKQFSPKSNVIVLTSSTHDPLPTRLLQLGAMGYLTKDSPAEEMIQAIIKVAQGERYLSSDIAQQIALSHLVPKETSPFELLSEREMQVMLMITRGLGLNEIANKLFLSPKTVGTYRYRMYDKLGIKNDVELTHLAMKHGVLKSDESEITA